MPIVKNVARAETTINLTISRSEILFPGECLVMQWDVMNAQRVLFNDELLPAAGETTLCVNAATQPTLQVMLMDGSEVMITQPVNILLTNPLFVSAALLTFALLRNRN